MKGADVMARWGRWLVAAMALGVIAFLALRASPEVNRVPWIPQWLGRWADAHGSLRNLPAFAGLAAVLTVTLGAWAGCGLAAVFAVGLEVAQLGLPHRAFDPADIGWSLLGIALVAVGAALAAGWRRGRLRRRVFG